MNNKGIIGAITVVRSCTGLMCLEWRIPRFFSLSAEADFHDRDFYDSPSFFFHDVCWHLRVYPNWSSSGWIYIENQNPGDSTDAVRFALGIKGSAGVEKREESKVEFGNVRWPVLECSRKELSGQKDRLMPNNALTISCEMKLPQSAKDPEKVKVFTKECESSEKEIPPIHNEEVKTFIEESESSEKEAMEELQNSLRSLLKGGEDCDVTVKVRDKEFRAHRLIMRMRSPVFQAMFSHNMLEKQKGVVTMDDTDPETFPDFLEHVYTGSVRMISVDNVISLFVTSDKYDLKTLRKECTRFMRENMTVASFCDVVSVAVRHNEEELLQRATEFFCNNSLELIKTVQWEIFMKENTTVGNELLIKLLSK